MSDQKLCCFCKDGIIYKSIKIIVHGEYVDDTEPLPQKCDCMCHIPKGEQP